MRKQTLRAVLSRTVQLLLAAILLCGAACPAGAAEAAAAPSAWSGLTYIICGMDDHPIILDGSGKDPDLTGYPLVITDDGRRRDLTTAAWQEISLHHNGETLTIDSQLEMVSRLFWRLGIAPSPLESVLVELSPGHIELTLASDLIYYDYDVYRAHYETIRRENPELEAGEESVVQVGANGERGQIYEVVWSNGAELSRQLTEVLDKAPVKEIVEYGPAEKKPAAPSKPASGKPGPSASSKKSGVAVARDAQGGGVLTLPSGETLSFSSAKSMSATAYTAGHNGVGYHTSSGTPARVGAVAVDPRVIPLGSKLYIVCNGGVVYGRAVAEDTGVRGNRIDLYFNTYQECINFGRRDCIVYILK